MDSTTGPLLISGITGVSVAAATFAVRDRYRQLVDSVERDLRDKMRSLRVPSQNLRRILHAWTVLILLVFLGLAVVLHSGAFAILAASILICAPWYVIRRMAQIRRAQIESQLADSMVTFSSAVKAGLSIPQALDILATQCPRPASDEFKQIVGEYQMGKPLERTLLEAKERLKSENFALFAAALLASRKSGGKLNETVDRIAHSVLELERLERKLMVETAQARRSAVYMALVPAVILVVYYFVDPVNTIMLFTTLPGQIILSAAIALDLVAYVWAQAILRPDI
ncbi:MAG TPA: type II secretion system F family protein [Pirellulales bacterium]|jgi:tight adherence protein B|nr:type II secretion system F family protein [Pirellulales bacterium]